MYFLSRRKLIMNNIVLIGHISRDIMIDVRGREVKAVGGAVIYAQATLSKSGTEFTVISKLPKDETELREKLLNSEVNWKIGESSNMTSIKNVYLSEDKEIREVTLISKADSFILSDIESEMADIYYFAGLFYGEIPDSMIEPLSKKGKIALDAQGVLRASTEDGDIIFRDWDKKKELMPSITYLKVDAAEAEVLTNMKDRERAIRALSDMGAKEVMLTHNKEVMLFDGKTLYREPYTNKNNSGRTGRGDTTFSSYLAWRENHGIEESLKYCTALCSIKMESPGVFNGSVDDVLKRMNS